MGLSSGLADSSSCGCSCASAMKDEQTPQVHLAEGVQLWDGNHTCGYPNIKKTKQKNPG